MIGRRSASPVGPGSTWKWRLMRTLWTLGQPGGSVLSIQILRANGTTLALGARVDRALLTGLPESNFRAVGFGGNSWLCFSSEFIMFLAPQCSLHLIFSEAPTNQRSMPWNCYLDERDICRPATETGGGDVFATHSLISRPTLQTTHTRVGESVCLDGKVQLSSQAVHGVRKGGERKGRWAGWLRHTNHLTAAGPTVSFHPQNTLYQPCLGDEETSPERAVLLCQGHKAKKQEHWIWPHLSDAKFFLWCLQQRDGARDLFPSLYLAILPSSSFQRNQERCEKLLGCSGGRSRAG